MHACRQKPGTSRYSQYALVHVLEYRPNVLMYCMCMFAYARKMCVNVQKLGREREACRVTVCEIQVSCFDVLMTSRLLFACVELSSSTSVRLLPERRLFCHVTGDVASVSSTTPMTLRRRRHSDVNMPPQ